MNSRVFKTQITSGPTPTYVRQLLQSRSQEHMQQAFSHVRTAKRRNR